MTKYYESNLAPSEVLLVPQVLVGRKQNFKTGLLGGSQEISIL